MQWLEIAALGVSLSFDAMTVAIGIGLCKQNLRRKEALMIAGYFGSFQGLMTLAGYLLGTGMRSLIQPVDHWIAFVLLLFVGGNMIREGIALSKESLDCPANPDEMLKPGKMLLLSIATSIDAMAAGLTLAVTQGGSVIPACLLIAVITFTLSLIGALLASRFSSKLQCGANVLGGLILIGIGLKTMIEHISSGI